MRMTSVLGWLTAALWFPSAWATNVYVAMPGTVVAQYPFTNWSMSATNIQDAVDAINTSGGNYVYVSNGVYYLTNQLVITNAITLRSWNNGVIDRTNTVIYGNNYAGKPVTNRCVLISNANAAAVGFTFTGGLVTNGANGMGAGCYMANGTLSNCVISNNLARGWGYGGGIYCAAGLIQNCVITRNTGYNLGGGLLLDVGAITVKQCEISLNSAPDPAGNGGGGVYASTPGNFTFDHCVISGNVSATTGGSGGGGILLRSTYVLRNCLIINNSAYRIGGGLYNWASDGRVENCTIVGNRTTGTDEGGGFYNYGVTRPCKIENSIIYFNSAAGAGTTSNYVTDSSVTWTNCCSAPDLNALSTKNTNNIADDPKFVDRATGNYRLSNISPCINRGGTRSWMATATDLDGCRRVVQNIVDMGAYEFMNRGAIFTGR